MSESSDENAKTENDEVIENKDTEQGSVSESADATSESADAVSESASAASESASAASEAAGSELNPPVADGDSAGSSDSVEGVAAGSVEGAADASDQAGQADADFGDVDLDDPELDGDYEEDEFEGDADPIEDVAEESEEEVEKRWYILKVQVNRENSICDALSRRVKMHGLENHFGDILVPTEDVKEFTKTGKQRVVKKKLYPGYIVVNMAINDETWFIVRETPGIGDFTGSVGKPAPIDSAEVEKILKLSRPVVADDESKQTIRNTFPYKVGDQVRVNEGNFQSLEGGVETIDESNGRITVMLNMFGRPTPVQLDHWQVEKV